jgi:proteasome lid subunit RPN8/RPN11
MKCLRLSPSLREQIHNEARAALPRECCGLVEGVRSGENVLATKLHPTRNIAEETDQFEIDPEAHFSILRSARARGAEIVGCYHSHPSGRAVPSAWDLANVGEEGFVWLIHALEEPREGEFAAFVVSAGKLVPITYENETS